jgi:predicted nuclease with TOPRIM domain
MNTKKQTSTGVMAEIERIRKNNARRNEKITQLRGEIVADNGKIKELERLHESLCQEEMQHRIAKLWFKEKKLSDEQIMKFLAISEQIGDQIDTIDTGAIIAAISSVAGTTAVKKQTAPKPTPRTAEPPPETQDEQE